MVSSKALKSPLDVVSVSAELFQLERVRVD